MFLPDFATDGSTSSSNRSNGRKKEEEKKRKRGIRKNMREIKRKERGGTGKGKRERKGMT